MKSVLAAFFLVFSLIGFSVSVSYAESLSKAELENQFEEAVKIDESIEWIIFTSDKKASENIRKVLEELKVTDLGKSKGMYVADISKMPSMISKMFAIPAMRDYPFKVVLDKEGTVTKSWPQKEGQAVFMELNKLEIVKSQFVTSESEIKAILKAKLQP